MEFKSQFIKTSVTSITTHKNVIFIGIGATLHVYCSKTSKLLNKINILDTRGEYVFGIIPYPNNLLIFGGNFLFIYNVNQNYDMKEIARAVASDWILEAKLIDNDTKIATISMQNKIHIWSIDLKLLESYECEEKCILYSAFICYKDYGKLTVLSGTVFNEVLIWRPQNGCKEAPVLKRLQKHEGVLFSLQYCSKRGLICSTSDDRSAILWKVNCGDLYSELQKPEINITPICQVYGHLSRVFRCLILDNYFITAGEDSILNIWKFNGELIRKIETNQGSPIWSVNYDKNRDTLLTGGGNGGVFIFSLNISVKEEKISLPNKEKPKLISVLASGNIIAFSNGNLFVWDKIKWIKAEYMDDLKSYVVMKVSKCRKLIALAGFNGQLYIYKEIANNIEKICYFQCKSGTRIVSIHWLSCDIILVCLERGSLILLRLLNQELLFVTTFMLDKRISTSACILDQNIVVGDRKGSIHLYKIDNKNPIQTIYKAHNYLGVTNLIQHKNNVVSLGRNGIIKNYKIINDNLEMISSNKLPFSWLLDLIDDFLIAFSSDNFLVWDNKAGRILFEIVCGGGHRSWDFYKKENLLTFAYIKESINIIEYDLLKNISYNLIEPFHLKEVNCMDIIKSGDRFIAISGGEDTTLRISTTTRYNFRNEIILKSHLSSIRCIGSLHLKVNGEEFYLIVSGGGRAQIVCWSLFYTKNIVCKENYSYYEPMDDESETRIMDLELIKVGDKIFLFAGCSDGNIRIFFIDNNYKLNLYNKLFYKLKCIYKVLTLKVFDKNVLVASSSDGCLTFWDINDILHQNFTSFHTIQVHQSGINTVSTLQLDSFKFIFLTAGDDNIVTLNYIKFSMNQLKIDIIDTLQLKGIHWAQITGSFINSEYFLTASVDQRLVLYKWGIVDEKIVALPLSKHNSAVPDLKGLICFDKSGINICIYGMGFELLKLVNK